MAECLRQPGWPAKVPFPEREMWLERSNQMADYSPTPAVPEAVLGGRLGVVATNAPSTRAPRGVQL